MSARPVLPLGCTFCASTNLPRMRPAGLALDAISCRHGGHQVATKTVEQAQGYVLRAAGRVEEDHWFVWRATGLHPHPGMCHGVTSGFVHHLQAGLIAVQHGVLDQMAAHQVEQRLHMSSALDQPARQALARDIDTVPAEHLLETGQRDAVSVLGGQQYRQTETSGHPETQPSS